MNEKCKKGDLVFFYAGYHADEYATVLKTIADRPVKFLGVKNNQSYVFEDLTGSAMCLRVTDVNAKLLENHAFLLAGCFNVNLEYCIKHIVHMRGGTMAKNAKSATHVINMWNDNFNDPTTAKLHRMTFEEFTTLVDLKIDIDENQRPTTETVSS